MSPSCIRDISGRCIEGVKDACVCWSDKIYWKHKLLLALAYGTIVAMTVVLFCEVFLLYVGIAYITIVLFVAPIIEEAAKGFIVYGEEEPYGVILVVSLSALAFGLIEWTMKVLLLGIYFMTFTPFLHVLFSLPIAIGYAHGLRQNDLRKAKIYAIIGYIIAVILHSLYNYWVVLVYGI